MKNISNNFSWKVLHHNINTDRIEEYDVLKYYEDFIKKLKKKHGINKAGFEEDLRRDMMYRYWSKSEHEVILEKKNNTLYIKPWVGSRDVDAASIIAPEDSNFDWKAFSDWEQLNWWGTESKIDIYDQLRFRWTEFLNYCWTFRHKYERTHRDI